MVNVAMEEYGGCRKDLGFQVLKVVEMVPELISPFSRHFFPSKL